MEFKKRFLKIVEEYMAKEEKTRLDKAQNLKDALIRMNAEISKTDIYTEHFKEGYLERTHRLINDLNTLSQVAEIIEENPNNDGVLEIWNLGAEVVSIGLQVIMGFILRCREAGNLYREENDNV